MKHVFTLFAFALMSSGRAQTVLPPNYPYNPDSDGDEFVAVSDVLMSVASYDSEFQAQSIMVDTLSLEEAIQILLQQQIQNHQDLIEGLTNSLEGVAGFEPCLLNWTCGCPLAYQGYDYATVQIGEQCWFAENLHSEKYDNGDAIPQNVSDAEWISTISGATAVYGENASNLGIYGRLYNWYAVDDARGLCPSGWHVPSDDEFTQLTDYLGGENGAGGKMKEAGFDHWNPPNTGATNSSGWTGLPGGYRVDFSGYFSNAGNYGFWWSSSPNGSNAWFRGMYNFNEDVNRHYNVPRYGLSVRCVRDAE